MLDITIIAIGKIKENNIAEAIQTYLKRLSPYARINLVELKAEPFSESTKAKAKIEESNRIIQVLEKQENKAIWLLAEKGGEYDSYAFAEFLDKETRGFVFAIGGALGWSDIILKKYRNHLSLSKMTMPHELARLVLLEQMYRATTILKNKTYHY